MFNPGSEPQPSIDSRPGEDCSVLLRLARGGVAVPRDREDAGNSFEVRMDPAVRLGDRLGDAAGVDDQPSRFLARELELKGESVVAHSQSLRLSWEG